MFNLKIFGRFLFLLDRDSDSDSGFDMYPVSELNPKPNSVFFSSYLSVALSFYIPIRYGAFLVLTQFFYLILGSTAGSAVSPTCSTSLRRSEMTRVPALSPGPKYC
jgi:hypothetical protein